jgi:hypothetical protein
MKSSSTFDDHNGNNVRRTYIQYSFCIRCSDYFWTDIELLIAFILYRINVRQMLIRSSFGYTIDTWLIHDFYYASLRETSKWDKFQKLISFDGPITVNKNENILPSANEYIARDRKLSATV